MPAPRTFDFTAHVRSGAAFLDEKIGPHWHRDVDPGALDMAHSQKCVLGQALNRGYGRRGYAYGCTELGLDPYGRGLTLALGFDVRPEATAEVTVAKWAALTAAWRDEVLRRSSSLDLDDHAWAQPHDLVLAR